MMGNSKVCTDKLNINHFNLTILSLASCPPPLSLSLLPPSALPISLSCLLLSHLLLPSLSLLPPSFSLISFCPPSLSCLLLPSLSLSPLLPPALPPYFSLASFCPPSLFLLPPSRSFSILPPALPHSLFLSCLLLSLSLAFSVNCWSISPPSMPK